MSQLVSSLIKETTSATEPQATCVIRSCSVLERKSHGAGARKSKGHSFAPWRPPAHGTPGSLGSGPCDKGHENTTMNNSSNISKANDISHLGVRNGGVTKEPRGSDALCRYLAALTHDASMPPFLL